MEMRIYGVIGGNDGITAEDVAAQMAKLKPREKLMVRINSRGGSVNEGLAIYNLLKERADTVGNVTISVDAAAFSAASVIMLAGNRIEMADNAAVMVHGVLAQSEGTLNDIQSAADEMAIRNKQLADIYAARTKMPAEYWQGIVNSGKNRWFTAEEAVDYGLAHSIKGTVIENWTDEVTGMALPDSVCLLVNALQSRKEHDMPEPEKTVDPIATVKDLKALCPGADGDFILAQLEAKATVNDAQAAFIGQLTAKVTDLTAKLEGEAKARKDAEAKAAELEAKLSEKKADPADSLNMVGEAVAGGNARDAYMALVEKYTAAGMSKSRAASEIYNKHRDVYAAYLSN